VLTRAKSQGRSVLACQSDAFAEFPDPTAIIFSRDTFNVTSVWEQEEQTVIRMSMGEDIYFCEASASCPGCAIVTIDPGLRDLAGANEPAVDVVLPGHGEVVMCEEKVGERKGKERKGKSCQGNSHLIPS